MYYVHKYLFYLPYDIKLNVDSNMFLCNSNSWGVFMAENSLGSQKDSPYITKTGIEKAKLFLEKNTAVNKEL